MSANATNGKLEKLLIEVFDDEKFAKQNKGLSFKAMFNPNKYNLKYEIEYDKKQASGSSPSAPKFSNMKQQELSLEFFLDGTGVEDDGKKFVDERVDEFLKVAYNYDGKKHKNNYLRISWSYLIFDCVLKDADISFTLFRSDGRPLRAKITAKFLGFVNEELRKKKEKKQSPDITHARIIKDAENLPLLAFDIYENNQYYIDVAKANGLVNFRKLSTGQSLVFPPLIQESN
ncbi:CIS tube protein [Emticicia sp. 17c]|uniref:CIS tube protein n=1 Tax=Emticicia sp. 17c TaxID=3127704 RepID=UPI00301D9546